MGLCVCIWVGVFVKRMGCLYMDGVLVNGISWQ